MPTENEAGPELEIAHVLAMDVVGYSTLLIDDQSRLIAELTRLVRETPRFRAAEAAGKLIRLPTGDGMDLVFFDNLEAPLECAMQISAALKSHPEIHLRIGIHSGPIKKVVDVNDRSNVAGAGIDLAQRVMDCGDAGQSFSRNEWRTISLPIRAGIHTFTKSAPTKSSTGGRSI